MKSHPFWIALLVVPMWLITNAVAQVPEPGMSFNGTTLTYYPRPSAAQCQSDCAATAQCQASTWIQAGTYNPGDSAMCYLVSAVTGRSPARGHISLVKAAAQPVAPLLPPPPVARPSDPNALDPSDLGNL